MNASKKSREEIAFETFLARSLPSLNNQPLQSIVISPKNPTWNDFGNQILADIRIKDNKSRTLQLIGFVMPLSQDEGQFFKKSFYSWVTNLEERANSQLISQAFHESAFMSLLDDDQSYRKLAQWCGSLEMRVNILTATNDINLARSLKVDGEELIEKIVQDDVFKLGVMRSSSAYRAFAKGGRFILRNINPWIEDARFDINIDVNLKGFDQAHVAKFIFSGKPTIVSDRVQVFIGKNGTGKSQLLNQLIGSLALSVDGSGAEVFDDKQNHIFFDDAADWKKFPNSVLVFSTDYNDIFPRNVRFDAALDYWYFSLASQVERVKNIDQGSLSLSRALLDLIRDESQILGKRRFKIFEKIINGILPLSQIHLPLKRNQNNVPHHLRDSSGLEWFSLEYLPSSEQALLHIAAAVDISRDLALIDENGKLFPPSSGQRVFLRFVTLALSVISQGSMIVIDEPETHLHPNLISEFMKLLHELLTATSSIAVVATHSPYVVREVPTVCVHVVVREGNTPSIGSVHLKTLGASVSSISDAVFGDAAATKFHRVVAERLSKEGKNISNGESERVNWLLSNFGSELNSEMLSTIRFLMERDINDSESADNNA